MIYRDISMWRICKNAIVQTQMVHTNVTLCTSSTKSTGHPYQKAKLSNKVATSSQTAISRPEISTELNIALELVGTPDIR